MAVYVNGQAVGVTKEIARTDMLQTRVDGNNSCKNLFYFYSGTSLDISRLDTSKVTDMDSMFYGCSYLTNVDVSKLDTSNVTKMISMFSGCQKLNPIDVSGFNTEKVTTMSNMFNNCSVVETLDVSGFNTSNVTDMTMMFRGCSKLSSLDLSNFDTSNVTNMNYMFYACGKLKEIKGILDLYSVTSSLSYLFTSDSALENVTLKNIRIALSMISCALLTNATLLNTAKELWDNTNNALGGTRTLTLSTTSKTVIKGIYVKLIDVTDDMIAQDQYIANKKPCVECASTDEGAMTLEEYIISKNWQIA